GAGSRGLSNDGPRSERPFPHPTGLAPGFECLSGTEALCSFDAAVGSWRWITDRNDPAQTDSAGRSGRGFRFLASRFSPGSHGTGTGADQFPGRAEESWTGVL